MSTHSSRWRQPLLIGSLVVLSVACRRDDDRSNIVETTNAPPETARNIESMPAPPRAMPDNQPSSAQPSSAELGADERMPVAGRDDSIELGAGGHGGATGMGGSAGSHH
jgi:hypothetical protein